MSPERPLRVLVVDDSAFNRRILAELLTSIDGVEVVGKAGDGHEGLRLAAELKPDLITLDLEMPRMDGFTFLRLLLAKTPTPVIVVSGYSAKENVFRALELGALDFVAKPSRTVTPELSTIREDLVAKVQMVRQLSPAKLDPKARGVTVTGTGVHRLPEARAATVPPPGTELRHVVLVGASTGGPTALLELFSRLPSGVPASIVVAQHMPERFTKAFAERLDRAGPFRVREAEDGVELLPGHAYVCPGGRCVEVASQGPGHYTLSVVSPRQNDRYVPSASRLFESAAPLIAERLIAVVLTGMGDDGASALPRVKDHKGLVLAESADTAVVYGMPASAVRTGCVERSLPLVPLAEHVASLLKG